MSHEANFSGSRVRTISAFCRHRGRGCQVGVRIKVEGWVRAHIAEGGGAHTGMGRGSTQCYAKQPHLTDEKNHTNGLGEGQWPPRIRHRGEEKQGIGGGTWSKILCTFCPHPCHFPPLHTTPGPDLVCPFFPPSLYPAAGALQAGSTLSSAGGGVGSKGWGGPPRSG